MTIDMMEKFTRIFRTNYSSKDCVLSKVFVISDTHFGDLEAIMSPTRSRYQKFPSLADMANFMVDNWNSQIGDTDIVYHLGDVAKGDLSEAENIIRKLNGIKRLCIGNHDDVRFWAKSDVFEDICSWYKLVDYEVVLSHYPLNPAAYDSYGSEWINIHGHLHGYKGDKLVNSVDVSVEVTEYKPIELTSVIRDYKNRN